jgi:hypothetical protein
MIEGAVAVLLLLTIGYCVLLNRRLKRLKSDEQALKATIAELVQAIEMAQRAVAGLKVTARECDQTLGERMRSAERLAVDLARQVEAGQTVLTRLAEIAVAARPITGASTVPAQKSDPVATARAAQALAARARSRTNGMAA